MDNQSLLDEMVSEDSIEMLKAALPYLSPQGQSFISVSLPRDSLLSLSLQNFWS